MSEFEQLPLESPWSWLRRLQEVDTTRLRLEDRRAHTYFVAHAKRLLEQAEQKAKWNREK